MKNIVKWSCVLTFLISLIFTSAFAQTKHEFDKKGFTKTAKKSIGSIISGNVNADKMITDMETLVQMGIAGCKEHQGEKETPAVEKEIMQLVINNAYKMKSLTLDEIESQWHEQGALKAKGIDMSKFDHFDEVMCHFDTVVHPATAIICLNEYKKTKNEELLEQVKAELAEVKEHLKHLE